MMRCILPILATLTLLCGCAQSRYQAGKLASINIIDRNGLTETVTSSDRLKQYQGVDFLESQPYRKVLRVYSKDSQGNMCAVITSYHPNGQPKQYLECLSSRAYGTYREWHPNGTLKLETTVIGGIADLNTAAENSWLFDGCSYAWDENCNLIAEIYYEKGELEGLSIYYHPDGAVWKTVPFHKGELEGTFTIYRADGQPLQTTEYLNGQKHGYAYRYWDPNHISSQELHHVGSLISGHYYSREEKLVAQIDDGNGYRAVFGKDTLCELHEYHNGFPEGKIKIFAKDESLAREYYIKNGLKRGEEIEYYAGTAQPKLSINWYDGKIQGVVKTWYPNGVHESQREMSHNKKNGIFTAWYRDGSLMLIEEYDQDNLLKGEYYKKEYKTPVSQVADGKGTVTLFDDEGNFLKKITYQNGKPLDA